jgi:hypothetical protein
MCRDTAKWKAYKKHKPDPSLSWSEIRQESLKRHNAFYHFDVVARIQELETKCLFGTEIIKPQSHKSGRIREFWIDAGEFVGCSSGEDTTHLFVEWNTSPGVNEFHGRPILKRELLNMGADA